MAGSDYHHGEQDITEQARTFHNVMLMTKWGCLALAAMLLMLVLWFCTPAGFGSGFIAAVIVLALGILLLRERGSAAH
jgi:hypothetical protein